MKHFLFSIALFTFSSFAYAQSKETLTLNFGFNKFDITPENAILLDSFVNKLAHFQVESIVLNGHCDSKGSDQYNDALSLRRVNSVKIYLQHNKNFNAAELIANGFGEKALLNDDATAEKGFENRRVEVIALLKDQPAPEVKQAEKTLSVILADTAVKTGDIVSLPDLQFENNSATLLRTSIPSIEELLGALVKNPKLSISIEGHICCVPLVPGKRPEELSSFDISVLRAKMVYDYLISKGIDAGRLSYKGFGSSHPIHPIPEKNDKEMIENRRVEIRIMDK